MKHIKIFCGMVLLTTLSLLFLAGCKKKDLEEAAKPQAEKVQAAIDTSQVQQEETIVSGLPELEEGKTEIEARLQALVSLIEEKEQSLNQREKRLLEQEKRLQEEMTTLRKKESSLARLQIISWVVLVIGLAGIIFSLVIVRRRDKGSKPEPEEVLRPTRTFKDRKDEYVQKMETQIKEWHARVDELKAKADRAKEGAKEEYQKQVEALRTKLESAKKKLQVLKDAGEETWEEVKKGVDKAGDDLKKAVENAVSRLNRDSEKLN